MDFMSDIALAFIAFSTGRYFRLQKLKGNGGKVAVITLFESLLPGILVTLLLALVFHTGWVFALLLGAIATATAPASTIMTIRQYGAKGPFVDTLLQVVALDDMVALIAFGVVSAVAQATGNDGAQLTSVLLPILMNILGLALGLLGGLALKWLLSEKRRKENRLILTIALLLCLAGICSAMNISPLLACMVFGAAYVNSSDDEQLFEQLDGFTPPVFTCFFVLSGMRLDLHTVSYTHLTLPTTPYV